MTDDTTTETDAQADDERDLVTSRRELVQAVAVATVFGEEVPVATIGEWQAAVPGATGPGPIGRVPRQRAATVSGDGATRFGTTVDVADEIAVVGRPPSTDGGGPSTGQVAVVTSGTGSWSRVATLDADPRSPGGEFGAVVATDGDTVVVGAPLSGFPTGPHRGSAHVFARRDGAWQLATTLTGQATDGVDRFGRAVGVDADTVIVGAPGVTTRRGHATGLAAVYRRDSDGWTRASTLTAPSPGMEAFGRSVALDGDTAVIGARATAEGRGAAGGLTVVHRRRHGVWTTAGTLRPASAGDVQRLARSAEFGTTLAVDGSRVLVGAPDAASDAGFQAGAVYVFRESAGRWRQEAALQAPGGGADHRFGVDVGLHGPVAIVGTALGSGPIVFSRAGTDWRHETTLTGASSTPGRETAVALERGTALVGAPARVTGEAASGMLEVFHP